ncbi:MAG: acetyl-CoA carboxylase biotin carboxyl carrier protein subunit [Deltaproteobacteria bacterium]|nr:acetyl-CoA carboxylase biotin carboxyl carrier protein subunit [Deltaproteobacteria bacterium]
MAVEIVAPMVGKVVKVLVTVGQEVEEDEPVVMIEAMKVEMPVVAPESGKVSAVHVKEGQTVEGEAVLVELA